MADIARVLQESSDEEADNCDGERDNDLSDVRIDYGKKKGMYKNLKYYMNYI